MPYLAVAFLILLLTAPNALAQAGVSYQVPSDNPFVGQAGAAPEVYALGLRNPYRYSFDRQTGDLLIGDVGGSQREEINWISAAGARAANFGWACREGKTAGPRPDECPVPGAVEPLFDYPTSSPDAVTGGFVVRDASLTGLFGRYLYADYYTGLIRSLALNFDDPDDQSTGLTVATLGSFGEDADGRLYAASNGGGTVVRLVAGGSPGTLAAQPLTGPFASPVALGTYPGDSSRLFVAEQGGKVRLVVNDAVRPTPFLDVAPFGLSTGGERGLLSVVAAPDHATSGKLYVYYTDSGGDIRIEEFTRSSTDPETADPSSRRTVLVIEHSNEGNHNGGQLHFGADGCLWVTTGDGGGQNNEHNNAQNLGALLGKILRFNPNPPGVGGPACGAAAAPPSGPGPGVGPDLIAPALTARVPRRQRVLRLRGAVVYVRCSEACSLEVGGTLRIGARRLLLRRAVGNAHPAPRTRLKVRLRERSARLLRRALASGRRPRVEVRLRAGDAAGNRSALVRRTVRVRR
ncbi:MAG TPA: PQQ-dependent sugar dehydrogenase [Thermoleophilaceae bacterium]